METPPILYFATTALFYIAAAVFDINKERFFAPVFAMIFLGSCCLGAGIGEMIARMVHS